MNAKQKKCWKNGHDWAYNFQDTKDGWIRAVCLRCGAEQYFFLEGFGDVPDLDDDGTEE